MKKIKNLSKRSIACLVLGLVSIIYEIIQTVLYVKEFNAYCIQYNAKTSQFTGEMFSQILSNYVAAPLVVIAILFMLVSIYENTKPEKTIKEVDQPVDLVESTENNESNKPIEEKTEDEPQMEKVEKIQDNTTENADASSDEE